MTIIFESNKDYHENTHAIGSSTVKAVLNSTVCHWHGSEFKQTTAMEIGSATHAMYLEPQKYLVQCGPETRRGKQWSELKDSLRGDQILLTEGDYKKAMAMCHALHENAGMAEIYNQPGWIKEGSIYADCPTSGLPLKVKIDGINEKLNLLMDVKTCATAAPREWSSAYGPFHKLLYNVQACFYLHVCKLAGIDVDKFSIFAVENTPPHATQQYVISRQTIKEAKPLMFAGLAQIKEARETGKYTTGWDSVVIL